MLKSFFFSPSFESKASESIDEEDILPERLWVLSHYQLLRRTCCEYTAVARESQKTKQVFSSNVLVIWLKNPKAVCQWGVNKTHEQPRNPMLVYRPQNMKQIPFLSILYGCRPDGNHHSAATGKQAGRGFLYKLVGCRTCHCCQSLFWQ